MSVEVLRTAIQMSPEREPTVQMQLPVTMTEKVALLAAELRAAQVETVGLAETVDPPTMAVMTEDLAVMVVTVDPAAVATQVAPDQAVQAVAYRLASRKIRAAVVNRPLFCFQVS